MTQPFGEEITSCRINRITTGINLLKEYIRHADDHHIERDATVLTGVREKRLYLRGWSHRATYTMPVNILPVWSKFAPDESVRWGITDDGGLVKYCFKEVLDTNGDPVVGLKFSLARCSLVIVNLCHVWHTQFLKDLPDTDLERIEQGIERLFKQGILKAA